MKILLRLKRGEKDPNEARIRRERRRKKRKDSSSSEGGEWWHWRDVHDKDESRAADFLPDEYIKDLKREERKRWLEQVRRRYDRMKHTIEFLRDVLPIMVTDERYYPYGRFVRLCASQERADVVAAIKALSTLRNAVRGHEDDLAALMGLDEDGMKWWLRGFYSAQGSLQRLIHMDEPNGNGGKVQTPH